MPVVKLRGPLKRLAGGRGDHRVEGATVREALAALEAAEPALAGWILDERACVRRHINVFVDGEYGREDTPVGDEARLDVLPAISGGER
ncbi:MAG TPA: MoaD/ThiS family protein [Solirubrobacteraceae bacterium]|nr:MoaD/ThiS family protein [Solirubrobacteraceae bacterium]